QPLNVLEGLGRGPQLAVLALQNVRDRSADFSRIAELRGALCQPATFMWRKRIEALHPRKVAAVIGKKPGGVRDVAERQTSCLHQECSLCLGLPKSMEIGCPPPTMDANNFLATR